MTWPNASRVFSTPFVIVRAVHDDGGLFEEVEDEAKAVIVIPFGTQQLRDVNKLAVREGHLCGVNYRSEVARVIASLLNHNRYPGTVQLEDSNLKSVVAIIQNRSRIRRCKYSETDHACREMVR